MLLKTAFAKFGNSVARIGFSVDKLLGGANIFRSFQSFEMARQIAIGQVEQIFHSAEICKIVDRQYRHNPQPDAAVESFI
jgi:hypothetical protein